MVRRKIEDKGEEHAKVVGLSGSVPCFWPIKKVIKWICPGIKVYK